jgi:hypothetical protein
VGRDLGLAVTCGSPRRSGSQLLWSKMPLYSAICSKEVVGRVGYTCPNFRLGASGPPSGPRRGRRPDPSPWRESPRVLHPLLNHAIGASQTSLSHGSQRQRPAPHGQAPAEPSLWLLQPGPVQHRLIGRNVLPYHGTGRPTPPASSTPSGSCSPGLRPTCRVSSWGRRRRIRRRLSSRTCRP